MINQNFQNLKIFNQFVKCCFSGQFDSKCPYTVLGVSRSSEPKSIKKEYLNLTKKYHPDRNKSKDAEETFKKINNAYEQIKKQNENTNSQQQNQQQNYQNNTYYNHNNSNTNNFNEDSEFSDFFYQQKQYRKEKQRTVKENYNFDYKNITENEIFKEIFGHYYHEAPMSYYKPANERFRKAFIRERQKMRNAQGINIDNEEISQEMKDFTRYRNEEFNRFKNHQQYSQQNSQSNPGGKALGDKELIIGFILTTIMGITGFFVFQKREDNFKGQISDERLQKWRKKALEHTSHSLPFQTQARPLSESLEKLKREEQIQL